MRTLLTACLLALASATALAARPMIIDDARIVDTKACQVESWRRFNSISNPETWAVPACAPIENLEISWGGAKSHAHEGPNHLTGTLLQGKAIVRELTPNGFGWGVALGQTQNRLPNNSTTFYLNLPATWSISADTALLHANLGLARDRRDRRGYATWGVGVEVQSWPSVQLIGEIYGEGSSRPSGQGGLRLWLVPNRVQIDATYGRRFQSAPSQRFFTLGVRLISPAFLP